MTVLQFGDVITYPSGEVYFYDDYLRLCAASPRSFVVTKVSDRNFWGFTKRAWNEVMFDDELWNNGKPRGVVSLVYDVRPAYLRPKVDRDDLLGSASVFVLGRAEQMALPSLS